MKAVKINSQNDSAIQSLSLSSLKEPTLAQSSSEAETETGTGTEIIGMILKPFISILEKVLLGKPSIELSGSAAKMDGDLHVKFKPSEGKVKVDHSATYGDAPVVYQFAEQATDAIDQDETP